MPLRSDTVLRRLVSISRAIAGQMDLQSVLEAFAAELQYLIPHDHADIVLLRKDGNEHLCYEVGLHTTWSKLATAPLPTAVSPIRSVLWGQVPHLLSDDGLSDPRFHFDGAIDEPIYSARLRSRIIVALRVQGDVIGSLNISRHEPGAYRKNDIPVAQHCADLIAPYLYALTRGEEARKSAVAEGKARAREEMRIVKGVLKDEDKQKNEISRRVLLRPRPRLRVQGPHQEDPPAGGNRLAGLAQARDAGLHGLHHRVDERRLRRRIQRRVGGAVPGLRQAGQDLGLLRYSRCGKISTSPAAGATATAGRKNGSTPSFPTSRPCATGKAGT